MGRRSKIDVWGLGPTIKEMAARQCTLEQITAAVSDALEKRVHVTTVQRWMVSNGIKTERSYGPSVAELRPARRSPPPDRSAESGRPVNPVTRAKRTINQIRTTARRVTDLEAAREFLDGMRDAVMVLRGLAKSDAVPVDYRIQAARVLSEAAPEGLEMVVEWLEIASNEVSS